MEPFSWSNPAWVQVVATGAYVLLTLLIAVFAGFTWCASQKQANEALKQTRNLSESNWVDLFLEFTRRYNEIWSEMPKCIFDRDRNWFDKDNYNRQYERGQGIELKQPDIDNQSRFTSPFSRIYNLLNSYFNLCSEEYYLAEERSCDNLVDQEAWKIWKDGIRYNLSYPSVLQAWVHFSTEQLYYPNFINWIWSEVIPSISEMDSVRMFMNENIEIHKYRENPHLHMVHAVQLNDHLFIKIDPSGREFPTPLHRDNFEDNITTLLDSLRAKTEHDTLSASPYKQFSFNSLVSDRTDV